MAKKKINIEKEYIATLKSLNGWTKFKAILVFLIAVYFGFATIAGLLGVISGDSSNPVSILMSTGAVVFSVFLGIFLWKSGNSFKFLDEESDKEEFEEKLMTGLTELRNYFRLRGILSIINIILFILLIVFAFSATEQAFENI